MNNINTEQIAILANVSRSTVSRVLNNYSNVPEETRLKVQAVIKEHGYTPNHFARSLAGAPSNIVGIYIADLNIDNNSSEWVGINSPYNMELLSNLIKLLKTKGYTALVNVITDPKEFVTLKEAFETRMIYGGIFTGFPYNTKEISDIAKKYNAVSIDQFSKSDYENSDMKVVNCDNFTGGYNATKYLIENGHTDILYVGGDNRLSSIEREKGYLKAMADFGISKTQVIYGMFKEDVSYFNTNQYLKNNKPTAIFAANDIISLGVIRACEENGYSVPEDISLIGFDNLKVASWLNLSITSLEVPLEDIAKSCIKLLFGDTAEDIIHTPMLIEKSTVKKFKL